MAIVRLLITLLPVVATLSCAKPQPAPHTPTTWNVPMLYRQCRVTSTVRWSGGWTVTLYCPEGMQLAGLMR